MYELALPGALAHGPTYLPTFGARVLPWTRRVGPSAFRHLHCRNMADVVERMRQDAARQQRVQWGQSLPARRSRVNLIQAAAVGPVLTDMYIAASPLGDG